MIRECLKDYISKEFEVSGVYMLQIGPHIYIGSSKNIRVRLLIHRKNLRSHKHTHKLQSRYDKYGEDVLYGCVLQKCDKSQLLQNEEFWITAINPDLNVEKKPTLKPTFEPWNNPGISKTVYRYNLSGELIDSFPSVSEAQRRLGVKSSVLIAAAANPNNKTFKSAYGYLWSYKQEVLPSYENHSKDAKIKPVIITEISTGKKQEFRSIADAVRALFPNTKDFEVLCSTVSGNARGRGKTIKGLYTAKYK